MRKLRMWLKSRFGKFRAMPLYFRALAKEWNDILFGETIVGVGFLVWWALANPSNTSLIVVFVFAMFLAGFYAWHGVHTQLETKIEIVQITPREWANKLGEARAGQRARAYQIEVVNRSEGVTIENVSVALNAITPKWENWEFLPIPLHLRHDNPERPQDQVRAFSLDPGEQRNVDFVSAFQGDNRFSVVHIVHGATWEVPYTDRNRLQVRITGKNMPPSFYWFKVWRDAAGHIQCEMEKE